MLLDIFCYVFGICYIVAVVCFIVWMFKKFDKPIKKVVKVLFIALAVGIAIAVIVKYGLPILYCLPAIIIIALIAIALKLINE